MTFLYILLFFCLVEFFVYFKFELQVYEIMTLLNQKMIFMIFGLGLVAIDGISLQWYKAASRMIC